MRPTYARAAAVALALCAAWASADAPAALTSNSPRARVARGGLHTFEHLNDEIVRRCHEPAIGTYADWRDEFHADRQRTRALAKAPEPGRATTRKSHRSTGRSASSGRSRDGRSSRGAGARARC